MRLRSLTFYVCVVQLALRAARTFTLVARRIASCAVMLLWRVASMLALALWTDVQLRVF